MRLKILNDLIEDDQKLKGRWELGPNHELRYRSKDKDEEVTFAGSLIAAEPDCLVIGVTEKQADQEIVTSTYKLIGKWKANPKNQLVFEVERESGKKDVLTFKAGWKVNDNHEILYTYDEINLKTKKKKSQELVFQGHWDLSEKNRLAYLLGGDSGSAFRFRGAFQTPSIFAKKGQIRYQLGVEAAGRHKLQTITLFGKWKLSRDLALDFEIEYQNSRRAMSFGGEYSLNDNTSIGVDLKTEDGKPLGVELILTRDFFKDGQAFIRLQRSLENSQLEAGMRVSW